MIDILIPTFNRGEFLKKNIIELNKQIELNNLGADYRILVSDNCSTDETSNYLLDIENVVSVQMVSFHQKENIGLEGNALFLLSMSNAKYVMYLGDDDFIPNGYLDFVCKKIKEDDALCIIPGYSSLYPDGSVKKSRCADFDFRRYKPGLLTVCSLSNFGHQLSGLVTLREGLYNAYISQDQNRNIYPFIFFVAYCMLKGVTYYAPMYQVHVSQGNRKDWCYDDSGLLTEIFKNYYMLYRTKPLKEAYACVSFVHKQPWRLRISKNPVNSLKAMRHIVFSKDVRPLVKIFLLIIYPYLYLESVAKTLRRIIVTRYRA